MGRYCTAPSKQLGGIKIICVEDAPQLLSSLEIDMGDKYDTKYHPNPMTAMDTIWKSAFQIIIPDIVMPEVCGSDILKDLVEDREPRMVLLISGFGQEQHLIQGIHTGTISELVKSEQ